MKFILLETEEHSGGGMYKWKQTFIKPVSTIHLFSLL
jgi:hypothetical protein